MLISANKYNLVYIKLKTYMLLVNIYAGTKKIANKVRPVSSLTSYQNYGFDTSTGNYMKVVPAKKNFSRANIVAALKGVIFSLTFFLSWLFSTRRMFARVLKFCLSSYFRWLKVMHLGLIWYVTNHKLPGDEKRNAKRHCASDPTPLA